VSQTMTLRPAVCGFRRVDCSSLRLPRGAGAPGAQALVRAPACPRNGEAPGPLGPDALLVAACLRGEEGALERLVERFQGAVVGTALRLVGDRDVALELANGAFFKLARSLDRYDPARPLRPWVLRFAANEALNWLRGRRRERERVLGAAAGALALARLPGGPDPEAAALAAERRAEVRAALARLPERSRLLLTLRFYHQLSYAEIGVRTGQDANTVGVQLLRARRRLRDELHRSGYADG
jgi:RNA polymerase sigma factor (sigma-70 family)